MALETVTSWLGSPTRWVPRAGSLQWRWILRLFQSEGHWIDVEEMRREMQQAGYRHVESFDFLPTQSFQVFALSDAELSAALPQDSR